jgi:chorismate--pyruvate lyase
MPSRDSDTHLSIPAAHWYRSLAAAGLHNPEVHGPARYWLQVEGSFTRALQRRCRRRFHVDVRYQGFDFPTPEEARRLRQPPRRYAWIREVRLCGDGEPWVLARTVIPLGCLEGPNRVLLNLGSRPLGAYLFSDPLWHRGPLETGVCRLESPAHPRLARRSLFHNGADALLVSEYLLPTLYQSSPNPDL